jgi:hypothetical protein
LSCSHFPTTQTEQFSRKPRLIADLEAVACEEAHRPVPTHGFRDQFIGFVGASLALLSGLGVLAGLVTLCAVIIGVILPFGLFS